MRLVFDVVLAALLIAVLSLWAAENAHASANFTCAEAGDLVHAIGKVRQDGITRGQLLEHTYVNYGAIIGDEVAVLIHLVYDLPDYQVKPVNWDYWVSAFVKGCLDY